MDSTIFRNNLKSLLYSRGFTAKSFAAEINVSAATISRYLSGDRDPELPYAVKISEYFHVSIDWLVGLCGDKYDIMPKELQEVTFLYSLASPDDRRVVQAVLDKYKKGV